MTNQQAAIAVIVGGVLAVVGSLLPWVTATTGFGSISLAGTDGDGVFTLGLGALIALAGFVAYARPTRLVQLAAFAFGLFTAGIGVIDYSGAGEKIRDASSDTLRASVGPGLYVVILAGFIAIAGAVAMKPESKIAGPAAGPDWPKPPEP